MVAVVQVGVSEERMKVFSAIGKDGVAAVLEEAAMLLGWNPSEAPRDYETSHIDCWGRVQ